MHSTVMHASIGVGVVAGRKRRRDLRCSPPPPRWQREHSLAGGRGVSCIQSTPAPARARLIDSGEASGWADLCDAARLELRALLLSHGWEAAACIATDGEPQRENPIDVETATCAEAVGSPACCVALWPPSCRSRNEDLPPLLVTLPQSYPAASARAAVEGYEQFASAAGCTYGIDSDTSKGTNSSAEYDPIGAAACKLRQTIRMLRQPASLSALAFAWQHAAAARP